MAFTFLFFLAMLILIVIHILDSIVEELLTINCKTNYNASHNAGTFVGSQPTKDV